jgi:hypothetical protein
MAIASKEIKGQQGPKALLAWTLMAMAEPSKTSQTGRNVLQVTSAGALHIVFTRLLDGKLNGNTQSVTDDPRSRPM